MQAVVQLQSIVSRRVDPVESAVVTIGSLNAGSAPNVIPDEARLQGTLRSWQDGGGQDTFQRARGEVARLLEAYQPPEVSAEQRSELVAMVAGLAREAGMHQLPDLG